MSKVFLKKNWLKSNRNKEEKQKEILPILLYQGFSFC